MTSVLLAHGDMVRDLGRAVVEGPRGLRGVQNLIVAVVREGAWRDFIAPGTGEHFTYGPDEFARFVAAQPFAGLGADVPTIRALCEGDPAALVALERAAKKPPHRPAKTHDNVITSTPSKQGNSREFALRQLGARPDLLARVAAGELSANAAAITAGFRHRATPLDTLRRTWAKASAEERAAFLHEIGAH